MITVAAFYRFFPVPDPVGLRDRLIGVASADGPSGTVIVASEGVNGTIAGTDRQVARILAAIRHQPGFETLREHRSYAGRVPFRRLKIRTKREIVTMGLSETDPFARVGTYVPPEAWNDLVRQDDVIMIDTRNRYEVNAGTFVGAVNPGTATFRDFPSWWNGNQARFDGKRIAMFCTGGIRCEKATSYALSNGARDVFHLQGGILAYLEQVAAEDSLWQGDCFVFDERGAISTRSKPSVRGLQAGNDCSSDDYRGDRRTRKSRSAENVCGATLAQS